MKLSMKLTLDGLVRALRWKAHALAEDGQPDYRRRTLRKRDKGEAGLEKQRPAREGQNDRTGI